MNCDVIIIGGGGTRTARRGTTRGIARAGTADRGDRGGGDSGRGVFGILYWEVSGIR